MQWLLIYIDYINYVIYPLNNQQNIIIFTMNTFTNKHDKFKLYVFYPGT